MTLLIARPAPPSPAPPKLEGLVLLEALMEFGASHPVITLVTGCLGLWLRNSGGILALTPEEAAQISALLGTYTRLPR